jgi:hypothetical protein
MFVNISHPHEIPMKAVNQGRTCIHSLTRSISLCSQGIGLAVLTKVKTYDQHNNEMATRVNLINIKKKKNNNSSGKHTRKIYSIIHNDSN